MNVGIDLLWVRPGKNGGTESYVRNIMDGFLLCATDNIHFILFVSNRNKNSFDKYVGSSKFSVVVCKCNTESQILRVMWETLFLERLGEKNGVDVWFFPVYSRPLFISRRRPNITVIHDLQGLHYPEYFSKGRNAFFRLAWNRDCASSSKIITISEFCKNDIINHLSIDESKIEVIYNSVECDGKATDFSIISNRYNIVEKQYLYTVSSLAKHKNLITLLKALKIIKKEKNDVKLVISGVKINATDEIFEFINENDLNNNVIYTGYISDEDRNSLYDNCMLFVFASVFEGFGMPPIEAALRNVPVLTTRMTSLNEVTMGVCNYVEEPYNSLEWVEKIKRQNYKIISQSEKDKMINTYNIKNTANEYINVFKKVFECN